MKMFKDLNVLVVGDIIVDHYIYGSITRISPEAPVPVLDIEREEFRLGGAGNTFLNVRGLGAKADLYGWYGLDYKIDHVQGLEKEGLRSHIVNLHQTIIKTRLIDKQQVFRYDVVPKVINPHQKPALNFDDFNVFILSDYNKGVIHQETLNLFRNNKLSDKTFLGLKPSNKLFYTGIKHVVMNRKELFEFVNLPYCPNVMGEIDEPLRCAIAEYWRVNPTGKDLLVTLSENGMCYCDDSVNLTLIPATTKNPIDVTGAGDTVLAAYALAYQTMSPVEAARFANECAGIVIQKQGTTAINYNDLIPF